MAEGILETVHLAAQHLSISGTSDKSRHTAGENNKDRSALRATRAVVCIW